MTQSTLATIGRVIDMREQRRKLHNLEAFHLLTLKELCQLRDALRLIESLNLKPETPSAYIQMLINGRTER